MSVVHIMPNGEAVPVPMEVVAQGSAAQQAFYDLQLERLAAEAAPAVVTRRSSRQGNDE